MIQIVKDERLLPWLPNGKNYFTRARCRARRWTSCALIPSDSKPPSSLRAAPITNSKFVKKPKEFAWASGLMSKSFLQLKRVKMFRLRIFPEFLIVTSIACLRRHALEKIRTPCPVSLTSQANKFIQIWPHSILKTFLGLFKIRTLDRAL